MVLTARGLREHAELRAAIIAPNVNFARADIDELLVSDRNDVSLETGRALRDRLNHEFGPTNVKRIRDRAPKLTPLARTFLNTSSEVLACLQRLWP